MVKQRIGRIKIMIGNFDGFKSLSKDNKMIYLIMRLVNILMDLETIFSQVSKLLSFGEEIVF